jgi:hypothetical protein
VLYLLKRRRVVLWLGKGKERVENHVGAESFVAHRKLTRDDIKCDIFALSISGEQASGHIR